MATSNKTKIIGVIAEDKSDIEVINEIFLKYSAANTFTIKKFVGNGCGKIKSKCRSWTETLFQKGCQHVFIFHDRDRSTEKQIRSLLESKVSPKEFTSSLIVIPIEEMEAWLLADMDAIRTTFDIKGKLKKIADCETVDDPKGHLGKLVYNANKKIYLNTAHNQKLAKNASLTNFQRCASFKPLDSYLKSKVF
jgi:hypothetical protein